MRIIGAAVAGLMTNEEASRQLGLCLRQVKRLKGKYRSLGEVGLIHGDRGRSPKHKTSADAQDVLVRGAAQDAPVRAPPRRGMRSFGCIARSTGTSTSPT